MSTEYLIAWSGSALPLGIAALGELVGQRCGVVNLGIEGTMLAGGFVAWVVMHYGMGQWPLCWPLRWLVFSADWFSGL